MSALLAFLYSAGQVARPSGRAVDIQKAKSAKIDGNHLELPCLLISNELVLHARSYLVKYSLIIGHHSSRFTAAMDQFELVALARVLL